jgi:hypothetical protein
MEDPKKKRGKGGREVSTVRKTPGSGASSLRSATSDACGISSPQPRAALACFSTTSGEVQLGTWSAPE